MSIDSTRITELRKACAEASDGPWGKDGATVEQTIGNPMDGWETVACCEYGRLNGKANARFIVTAHFAMPELLDEVERLSSSKLNATHTFGERILAGNKERDHHRETLRWLYRNLMKDAVELDTALREREPWLFEADDET